MSNNHPPCNNDKQLRTSWVRITAPTSAAFKRACRVSVSRGWDGMMGKNGKCTVIDDDRDWLAVVFRMILVRGQFLQDHRMWQVLENVGLILFHRSPETHHVGSELIWCVITRSDQTCKRKEAGKVRTLSRNLIQAEARSQKALQWNPHASKAEQHLLFFPLKIDPPITSSLGAILVLDGRFSAKVLLLRFVLISRQSVTHQPQKWWHLRIPSMRRSATLLVMSPNTT